MKKILVLAVFLLLVLAQSVSAQEKVVFQKTDGTCTAADCGTIAGYTGVQDTWIQQDSMFSSPKTARGDQMYFYLKKGDEATPSTGWIIYHYSDGTTGDTRDGATVNKIIDGVSTHAVSREVYRDYDARILVQYDIAGYIPENSRILSAELELYKYAAGKDPLVSVYQITAGPWDEKTLTWNNSVYGASDLSTIGTELSETDVGASTGWYSWDVLDAVEDWYSSGDSNNFGLLLAQDATQYAEADLTEVWNGSNWAITSGGTLESYTVTQNFYSSDFTTNQCLRPRLIVTYEAVPEPATLLLLGLGMVGLAGIRRRFKK